METVLKLGGGSIDANRYYDAVHPAKEDDRDPADIINNIKNKLNGG